MQLELANKDLKDISAILSCSLDLENGKENDFELLISREDWRDEFAFGNYIYVKDTDFGGRIGEVDTSTAIDTISILGYTWRGLLAKKIIEPPKGSDYKTVNGELNTVLHQLISAYYDDIFSVSDKDTGVNVSFQFDRYCTLLDGIEKMLLSKNYRLNIKYIQKDQGQSGYVELSAEPIIDYSNEIELSQDSRLDFSMKKKQNGVNHLICLGQGELQARQVIHLYVQDDGSITEYPFYTGIDEITDKYENTSAKDLEELKKGGIERLKELMNSTKFEMNVVELSIDVAIGDIIGGRDYLTGFHLKKPIVSKILRLENDVATVEYDIEGDD